MICIRNLPKFRKNGCPQTKECPCWIERIVEKDGKQEVVGNCLDLWLFDLLYDLNYNLVGNQQAIESFRNNTAQNANNLLTILHEAVNKKYQLEEYEKDKLE